MGLRWVAAFSLVATAAHAAPLREDCRGRAGCEAACTAGIGAGCRALAAVFPERRDELLRRGCTLGDANACRALFSVARSRKWDAEVRRVVGQARAAAHRQCKRGDALLCRSYAALLIWAHAAGAASRGEMHAAIAHARARFRRGCDAGDPRACAELASALSGATDLNEGIVSKEEHDRAWPLYEKACAGGYGRACESLEWNVADRFPRLAEEEVDALRWKLMQEACDKGDGAACERSGDLAEYHRDDALRFYQKGCDLEHAASCGKAAWAYGDARHGARRDPVRARGFAEKSCDGGDQSGCVMLSRLIRATDPARARRLLQRACTLEPHFYDCKR